MLEFSLKSTVSAVVESLRVTGGGGDIEGDFSNGESRLLPVGLSAESSLSTLAGLLPADNRLGVFPVEKGLKSKFLRS